METTQTIFFIQSLAKIQKRRQINYDLSPILFFGLVGNMGKDHARCLDSPVNDHLYLRSYRNTIFNHSVCYQFFGILISIFFFERTKLPCLLCHFSTFYCSMVYISSPARMNETAKV